MTCIFLLQTRDFFLNIQDSKNIFQLYFAIVCSALLFKENFGIKIAFSDQSPQFWICLKISLFLIIKKCFMLILCIILF